MIAKPDKTQQLKYLVWAFCLAFCIHSIHFAYEAITYTTSLIKLSVIVLGMTSADSKGALAAEDESVIMQLIFMRGLVVVELLLTMMALFFIARFKKVGLILLCIAITIRTAYFSFSYNETPLDSGLTYYAKALFEYYVFTPINSAFLCFLLWQFFAPFSSLYQLDKKMMYRQ